MPLHYKRKIFATESNNTMKNGRKWDKEEICWTTSNTALD